MTEVYAVFEGDAEMYYGYPPNLHGLFATQELAEEAARQWQKQAERERDEASGPKYLHSTFQPLYVVPIPVYGSIPPMPTPGNINIGHAEWLALHKQGLA